MDNDNKRRYSRGETILWMILTAATVFVITSAQYTRKTLGTDNNENIASTNNNVSSQNFKKLEKVLGVIEENYLFDYDLKELEEGAIQGLVDAIEDPYTDYFNVSQSEEFLMQTEGEYEGVGIYMALDVSKNLAIVLAPIEGSPADEAGVQSADYIIKVGETDVRGMSTEEISSMVKGPKNTTVKITFRRYNEDNTFEEFEKVIERREIELNPFSSKVIDENIGYIKFTSFDEQAYNNFKKALSSMQSTNNIEGLVIDLRDNVGGLLNIAVDIIDDLLPTGVITYTVDKNDKKEYIYSNSKSLGLPIVVIINENSASAAEIMAGAIKADANGKVVGKTSYGKGLVQQLKSLNDGTYLKVTISEYFSPTGNKINELGVEPDYVVETSENKDEDPQFDKAVEVIKGMIK